MGSRAIPQQSAANSPTADVAIVTAEGDGELCYGGVAQPAAPKSRDAAKPAKELIPQSPPEQEPDATAAKPRVALKGTMVSLLQSPVKGRDLRSGTPKEVNITEEDTAEALNDILRQMVNGIKRKVDQKSESSADEEKEGKGTNSEER